MKFFKFCFYYYQIYSRYTPKTLLYLIPLFFILITLTSTNLNNFKFYELIFQSFMGILKEINQENLFKSDEFLNYVHLNLLR